jgi:hypothetical protein
MAHIFKHPTETSKGIIVLTHLEANWISTNIHAREKLHKITEDYFVGVHYGGFSKGSNLTAPYSFYMGLPSVVDISDRNPNMFHIPLASGNFTSSKFHKNEKAQKYWDIINVSRNGNVKKLQTFMREVKKIYDLGYEYNILLVCASREEETEQDHFIDIADVYYNHFSDKERDMFTLLRLGKDLEFKGLSKKQLAFFYQSSKVNTLFSEMEGFPGVIPEGMLCGLPTVIWSNQHGSARDFLTPKNSVLFDSYDEAHKSLIYAVENYQSFEPDKTPQAELLKEESSLLLLKNYFSNLYAVHGQVFDGQLINTDDLVSRVPAHYVNLPWVPSRHGHGHVNDMDRFLVFCDNLRSPTHE